MQLGRRHRAAGELIDAHARTHRLWPTGLLYSALALAVTLFDRPIDYVADNRFEQYFNPARSLAKMFSVWDGSRGLGGPREDVWLGTTIPPALLRGLGLPPAWSERVWHSACLVLVGLGIVALLRVVRPRIGTEHVVAGLLVMFGPFTASFLLPSNLYVMFALSPWLLLVFIRGVTQRDPWKWAAAFALLVLVAGSSDTPGLLYVVVMMVPTALYLVVVERVTNWRRIVGWCARAAVLAVSATAWILAKTYFAAEPLDARLADTELPSASATSSSWSESFRGLGNWLSYFREEGRLLKPQTVAFFEQPVVMLATFLLPVVALVVFWRSTRRHRLLFGSMMLAGLTMMVGGFQAATSSPLSDAILWLLEHSNTLLAFRNTYKAAGGLVIGVAVLAAIGYAAARRRVRTGPRWRRIAVGAAGLALFAGWAQPFVAGSMYHPYDRTGPVPSYWSDTFRFLNRLDTDGRSLIVPAVSQAQYRWGYVGDDIFDALLTRPHATATGWMLSTRTGHNALETMTLWSQQPTYRPGVLGPMARRLGITEIVVRNDLDWARLNIARPTAFDGLRTDPDFELVASFGDPGLEVVSPFDLSDDAHAERSLRPVEIYRLRDRRAVLTTATATADSRVVATGDAGAIPQLVLAGLLPAGTDVEASAAADDSTLVDALEAGAPVVVTDTGQRRVRTLLHHEPQLSPVLAPDEELDRPVRPVHPDTPGGESVVWYRDALAVTGAFTRLGGNRNDLRAGNAFDDDSATAWAVPWSGLGPRPTIEVVLRKPTVLRQISIRSTLTPIGLPTVAAAVLTTDDGTEVEITTGDDGTGEAMFDPVTVRSFRLAPSDINVFGAEVGFAEVHIDGLDLIPHISTPTDLRRPNDPRVEQLVAEAPIAYTFRRISRAVTATRESLTSTRYDEEVTIRRRFSLSHSDRFDISGDLRMLEASGDGTIAELIGGSLRATSDRPLGATNLGNTALLIDNDTRTTWSGPAVRYMAAQVHFEPQAIDLVRVIVPSSRTTARLTLVEVRVGDRVERLPFSLPQCTRELPRQCTRVASIVFDRPVRAESVEVLAIRFDKRKSFDRGSIRIGEIVVGGNRLGHHEADTPLDGRCADRGLQIASGGSTTAVPVRVVGTVGQLLRGETVHFQSCEPVDLPAGEALLRTSAGSSFDRIALVPTSGLGTTTASAPTAEGSWRQTSSDRFQTTIPRAGNHVISLRMSFDPRWKLKIDGRTIAATESNSGNVWRVTTTGPEQAVLEYDAAAVLRWALLVSLLATVLCVVLAVRRAELLDALVEVPRPPRPRSRRSDTIALLVASGAGTLLIGPGSLAIGGVLWVLLRYVPSSRVAVGVAPPLLLALAGLWSVTTGWGSSVSIGYASQRLGPSALAALAAVFLFQALALDSVAARSSSVSVPSTVRFIDRGTLGPRWPDRADRASAAIVAVAAIAASTVLAARGRPGAPAQLLDNLRVGTEYTASPMHGPAATSVPPLGAIVAAWTPLGLPATMFVLGVLYVGGVALLVRRTVAATRSSTGSAVVAGAAAVVGMLLLRDLGHLVAAATAVWTLLLASRPGIGSRTAFAVGTLAAAAALAQPWAMIVVLPVLALWTRRRAAWSAYAAFILTIVVLVAPWWNVVWTS